MLVYYNNIWTDKSILLGIIYYILNNITIIEKKGLSIDNKRYRSIIKKLFISIKIHKKKHNTIYISIRNNNSNDICIDYLKNYDKYIYTDYIKIIPWYDPNDPLILYKYNKHKKLKVTKILHLLHNHSNLRTNQNMKWDYDTENSIYLLYNKYNNKLDCKSELYKLLSDHILTIDNNYYLYKSHLNYFIIFIKNVVYKYNNILLYLLHNFGNNSLLSSFINEFNILVNKLYQILLLIDITNFYKIRKYIYISIQYINIIINKFLHLYHNTYINNPSGYILLNNPLKISEPNTPHISDPNKPHISEPNKPHISDPNILHISKPPIFEPNKPHIPQISEASIILNLKCYIHLLKKYIDILNKKINVLNKIHL